MREIRVARRYAGALFALALERGIVGSVLKDLDRICETLEALPDAREILVAPPFDHQLKREITDRLFSETVSPTVLDFLHLVVEKKRAELLEDIRNSFEELKDRQERTLAVRIISAVALRPAELDRLVEVLESRSGQKIRPGCEVDPNILGGLIVVMGDTVLDGSVRTGLVRLRELLARVDVTSAVSNQQSAIS